MDVSPQLHDVYDATSRAVELKDVAASLLGPESEQYDVSEKNTHRRDLNFGITGSKSRGFVLDSIFSEGECANIIAGLHGAFGALFLGSKSFQIIFDR